VPDRSLIFNAKGFQIGYIEDDRAFDLAGRERCKYARATSTLTDLNGTKIVGYISLDGTFVGLSWISDHLFGKPSGEIHPDRALRRKQQLHQHPKMVDTQLLKNSNVEEPRDVPLPLRAATTVRQPENLLVEHSPTTSSDANQGTGSDASEKMANEVPEPYRESTVGAQNSTKSSSTQDELVDRAIGMIRTALENGSDAAAPA
jgi:hypothetical protein